MSQQYEVNQHHIETILNWVAVKEIAIPEIQRPFVWDASQVRDLMDSLYKGYPVGYLIGWRNPSVRLKDGTLSQGKKILIDGQQRVTALTAAILGQEVVDKDYRKIRIRIAFHPLQEIFEVTNPAIEKNGGWLPDIAEVVRSPSSLKLIRDYCAKNHDATEERVETALERLRQIPKKQIGFIELSHGLDIATVTEIFIRINREGVVLSQADFAMSKIAARGEFGANLRKCIDYFCHLIAQPDFYAHIAEVDKEFGKTPYLQQMAWVKNLTDDIYEPSYSDVLRVAFTTVFNRGKLQDLVSLLSGRNFETRTYEDQIAEESFKKLEDGILRFIKKTHYERFLMIVQSAGFTFAELLNSKNVLNFAYILYLKLVEQGEDPARIESYVRRWLVMSILTERYSSSIESQFEEDTRELAEHPCGDVLKGIEDTQLSDSFWTNTLVDRLINASNKSPLIKLLFAAQVQSNDKGFLSSDISVRDMITHSGDIHHLFPQNYLKKNAKSRSEYNQIANFVYTQTEINIRIGDKAPKAYFGEIVEQCHGGRLRYGGIKDMNDLRENLRQNCIPESVMDMEADHYTEFLDARRQMIAARLRTYYGSL